jgi:uncharacterized membrane protein (DUF373 family)
LKLSGRRLKMHDLYSMKEPLIMKLRNIIRFSVRILAILMTFIILLGVIDIGYIIYEKLVKSPFLRLKIDDILTLFGAFMAVLIAIEIFINISIYLREDIIHVRIVIATALMAIARKVIILDYNELSAEYVWATAGVVLAMSIAYWLVMRFSEKRITDDNNDTKNEAEKRET